MKTYDIDMLTRPADRTSPDNKGWCFGLPPGIGQEQWPLDPNTGYPLMHGFTLLLPEEYRVHGPDWVALSFFAVSFDHGAEQTGAIHALFDEPGSEAPEDPDLRPFWQAIRTAHSRLHRMEDSLGASYAVILLTRSEFDGPLCRPPRLAGNPYLNQVDDPEWLAIGTAATYWKRQYSPALSLPAEEYHIYKMLGQRPDEDLSFNRALAWTARANDPNAGKPPAEQDASEDAAWAQTHKRNHIGGTMRPLQATPEFSPFYIEFEEYLGGYNFGSGNAQLDFRDMKFDWATG